MRLRVIPTLLLHGGRLVKSVKFKDYKYIGDPINAVRIFNEKEVDEIAIVDLDATRESRKPNFSQISEIVSEAFMPVAYGGGITTVDEIQQILSGGVEKVIINKSAITNPKLITQAAIQFGSQSILASIDVRKKFLRGYFVYTDNGKVNTSFKPELLAKKIEDAGAGEILLNSIDRDGTYDGYDAELIHKVANAVSIPVIAVGGAASISDFKIAYDHGASAVAAGSMFVFKRPHQAVLISYPGRKELSENLFNTIS